MDVSVLRNIWKYIRFRKKLYLATEPYNKFSYIKDAVDDVIEKVLETGGDVEFVDAAVLNDYQHIALLQYY